VANPFTIKSTIAHFTKGICVVRSPRASVIVLPKAAISHDAAGDGRSGSNTEKTPAPNNWGATPQSNLRFSHFCTFICES
jgi:hypothetical protein